jgi:hypothetical protein
MRTFTCRSTFLYALCTQGGESTGVGVWRQEARQSGEWCAVAPWRKDLYIGESRAHTTISDYVHKFVL